MTPVIDRPMRDASVVELLAGRIVRFVRVPDDAARPARYLLVHDGSLPPEILAMGQADPKRLRAIVHVNAEMVGEDPADAIVITYRVRPPSPSFVPAKAPAMAAASQPA
jgi:hypothetical protein